MRPAWGPPPRRRPPWWPENQPWPPQRRWRRGGLPFFWRMGCVILGVIALVALAGAVVTALVGAVLDSLLGPTLQRTDYSSASKPVLTDVSVTPQDDADINVVSGLDVLSNSNVRTSILTCRSRCASNRSLPARSI